MFHLFVVLRAQVSFASPFIRRSSLWMPGRQSLVNQQTINCQSTELVQWGSINLTFKREKRMFENCSVLFLFFSYLSIDSFVSSNFCLDFLPFARHHEINNVSQTDHRTDEWMDGRTDGWMDGRMDG